MEFVTKTNTWHIISYTKRKQPASCLLCIPPALSSVAMGEEATVFVILFSTHRADIRIPCVRFAFAWKAGSYCSIVISQPGCYHSPVRCGFLHRTAQPRPHAKK
jgi:hypothetical protein